MLIPTDTKDSKNAANLKPGKLAVVSAQSTNSFKPAISVITMRRAFLDRPRTSLNDSGFFGCSEADDTEEMPSSASTEGMIALRFDTGHLRH